MADYSRVFKTSNEKEANDYINNGWDLIDTSKVYQYDDDVMHGSYISYTLGLSSKEYAKKLLNIIKEYEEHDLKEVLYGKILEEPLEHEALVKRARTFLVDYEDIVNNRKIVKPNGSIDESDIPYSFANIEEDSF